MAASVSNMLSIDPMKNGKHPVTISDQLRSRSEARETNYTSVQCPSIPGTIDSKTDQPLRSQPQAKALYIAQKDNHYTIASLSEHLQPHHLRRKRWK